MRRYQDPIRIDRHLSLETIKIILSNPDYGFFENDVFSEKYRSKISIGIWKDCIVLYPLEKCSQEFIAEIKEKLEEKRPLLILCDICDNYLFPEIDEDGAVCVGCKEPKVLDIFMNFHRKYQCKYYKKISYLNMLKATKARLSRLTSLSFYYRDKKDPKKRSKEEIEYLKHLIHVYLECRDYLFSELKKDEIAQAYIKKYFERIQALRRGEEIQW